MPRVKIDYIVSFSSEDPEHPSTNLLANEISKKKWLAKQGEGSCSIVLQLKKSVKISAVHIGVHHAAVVEIFVGRSERPDEFKAFTLSNIFLTHKESRQDSSIERVKLLGSDSFIADVKDQKWDRVRVVCSQPYNRFCKYGLGFIHIFESDTPDSLDMEPSGTNENTLTTSITSKIMELDVKSSDDEETFKPGELFAKHFKKNSEDSKNPPSTETQIRKATSEILKHKDVSSTKLVKNEINKGKLRLENHSSTSNEIVSRQRNNVMYNEEDDAPHDKIDAVVKQHKEEKAHKAQANSELKQKEKHKNKISNSHQNHDTKKEQDKDISREKVTTPKQNNSSETTKKVSLIKEDRSDTKITKKRHSSQERLKDTKRLCAGPVSSSPHELLRGVVFVLSGYENPRRASIRDSALAMGAKYERDWNDRCTHLVCAFPNTPKLRIVRSLPRGNTAVVVTGEWVEECCQRRRLLPWQWFATEPELRTTRPADWDADNNADIEHKTKHKHTSHSRTDEDVEQKPKTKRKRSNTPNELDECDTDDEIERVLQKQKGQGDGHIKEKVNKHNSSGEIKNNTLKDINSSRDSDVAFVRDERIQANVTIESDGETTEEEAPELAPAIDPEKSLPDFFEGCTFLIDEDVTEAGFDINLLKRYVYSYGGEILKLSEMDESSEVTYVLCKSRTSECAQRASDAHILRADWLWRCHEKKKLCKPGHFLIS